MNGVKRILIAIFILACLAFVAQSMLLGLRIYKGMKLAEDARPFCIKPSRAEVRVLIVGGGLGAGAGAEKPSESIAGRMAREFPSVEIVNRSRAWARASDVLEQLESTADEGFDLVLVQAGEEDVICFTGNDAVRETFLEILHLAARKAPAVIFMGPGNTGLKPAFFPPITWMYTERARKAREMFILLSREAGAEYVDLYRERTDDPFLKNPAGYFAADKLHPGNNGYAAWYEELKAQTTLVEALALK